MRRRRFLRNVTGDRTGGQRTADRLEFLQRTMQKQRRAGFLVARGGQRIAEFAQRVLLERKARLQLGQAVLEFFGVMRVSGRSCRRWTERPRPMP